VKPSFAITAENAAVIAGICQRLDGLPLAIELAAARIKILSPQALLSRLERSFDVLKSGARDLPTRQQTLHSTTAWSYDLLDPSAKTLFARLAVFAGGWTLEAAEAVCNTDCEVFTGIESLIDNSLIKRIETQDGEPRFGMLQTMHEYAHERLIESGEETALRQRHADYYLVLAEAAAPKLHGAEQMLWLDRLELEHDNLRAARDWFFTQIDGIEENLRLAAALSWFWFVRGHWSEGRQWLDNTLAPRSETIAAACRARALNAAGLFACYQGDSVKTRAYLTESIALCQQADDKPELAYALAVLSVETQWRDDLPEARSVAAQSVALFREVGDRWGLAYALYLEGLTAFWQGDYAATRALYDESIALFRAVGDRWRLSGPLGRLGDLAYREGDHTKARSLYEQSLAIFRELQDKPGVASSLSPLGDVARALGEFEKAIAFYQEGLTLYQELGDKQGITWASYGLGMVARQQRDFERAESFLQRSLALLPEVGDGGGIPWVMQDLGYVKYAQGNYRGALTLFQMALSLAHELEHVVTMAFCLPGLAGTVAGMGQLERAARLLGQAETLRDAIVAVGSAADSTEYDRALAEIRARIDETAYASALADGRAMSLNEAVAYASQEMAPE
jgi:tetratricopeptide (TPR) repeat protein